MTNGELHGPLAPYLERILSAEDKVLFAEAAKAAAASALRAAYVMVWLSCAESLKLRFRELAPRDREAQKVVGEVQRRESNQQAIDRYLLDQAKEYGFISDTEFTQLEYVYKMRCIYGHPYEDQPSSEELFAAASVVVEAVLSRPTKLRQGYLSEQVRLLTKEPTFLDDTREAVDSYAEIVFDKASDDLHLWLLRKLWDELAAIASDPSMEALFRRGVWFSRSYLRRCMSTIAAEWDAVGDLVKYPLVLSTILSDPVLFSRIGEHARDIVVGNNLAGVRKNLNNLRHVERLQMAGILTDRQSARFLETIKQMSLSEIASSGISPVYYANAIIEELKSLNWYRQNPAINVLRNLGKSGIASLPEATQRLLGNNVLQAADGECVAAVAFLQDLPLTGELWPETFVEGLLSECVINDRNEIRFKTRRAKEAMLSLRTVTETSRETIINRLIQRIRTGKMKQGHVREEERALFLRLVGEVVRSDDSTFKDLLRLAETIAQLEVPHDES